MVVVMRITLAARQTRLEAYRRGVNLSEGYSYAKARENQIVNDARANTGLVAGTAAELLGGSVAGGGLGRAGFTTSRMLSSRPGLVGRTLTSAADTAGRGGIVVSPLSTPRWPTNGSATSRENEHDV